MLPATARDLGKSLHRSFDIKPLLTPLVLFLCVAAGEQASAKSTLSPAFCQNLVTHTPSADVAYQAGRDVRGKAVVPADLGNGPQITVPDEMTIPLTISMMDFLKLDQGSLPASAMERGDIPLGTLTLQGSKVYWNGKPLTDEQQDNLAVLCLQPSD